MKNRIVALSAALFLAAAPIPSALAFGYDPFAPSVSREVETFGARGVHDGAFYDSCPRSSAAEGNANQQTRPVKQYGQTSGGYRC